MSVKEKDVPECGEPILVLDRNLLCQAFLADRPEAVEARLLSRQGGRQGRSSDVFGSFIWQEIEMGRKPLRC